MWLAKSTDRHANPDRWRAPGANGSAPPVPRYRHCRARYEHCQRAEDPDSQAERLRGPHGCGLHRRRQYLHGQVVVQLVAEVQRTAGGAALRTCSWRNCSMSIGAVVLLRNERRITQCQGLHERPCLLLIEHRSCDNCTPFAFVITKFNVSVFPSLETVRRIVPTRLPALFNANSAALVSICIPERLSKSGLPIEG